MLLTILTPLYNRQQYLDRIFASLMKQSNMNFEWLVVDDGSAERSDAKFEEYYEKAPFKVKYYYKENGGKHTAINFAHNYIEGDVVLILDSDDYLCESAVSDVLCAWEKDICNASIGVISFCKGSDENTPLVKYPEETVSDHITYRINRGIEGDCCETVRSSAFKEYPFPEFEGEKFMDEIHLWYGLAEKYKTRYINKVIYVAEYLDEGLTNNVKTLHKNNPKGAFYNQTVALRQSLNFKNKVKRLLLASYFGRLQGMGYRSVAEKTGSGALLAMLWIPGAALYYYWKRKY